MNAATLLHNASRSESARTAIALGTRAFATYGELSTRVGRIARGLESRYDARPGDRVALLMFNRPEYLECLFACWHAGLIAVPINAKLHAREASYIIANAGARACFVDADLYEPLTRALAAEGTECTLLRVDDSLYATLAVEEALPPAAVEPHAVAWLFYTSGTTGRPKGAMLTHRNLVAMTMNYFCDIDSVAPGDTIVHAAPLSHGAGLYALPHIAKGAVNVIPESGGFDAAEIFALVRAYPNVSFFAVPTMIVRLTAYAARNEVDVTNLKTIVYGGGPMYVADIRDALERFGPKFVQLYGQGETPMTITALSRSVHAERDHPRYEKRLASVGVARIGCEVDIVDDEGAPLAAGETGEIVTRSDIVMSGYWKDPEATARALRGGWLHTGDIGSFDQEGYLHLKDRAKDMIISGGTNIYPREIEEVLLKHDAVREVAVVGRPNPEWGEEVVAFVVRAEGANCDEAELADFCLEYLARFKRPRAYHFVDELPKSGYGKVLKTSLRERLSSR